MAHDAKEGAKRIRIVAQLGNLSCGDVEMSELFTSRPPSACTVEGPVLTHENERIRHWKIAIQGIHGNEYVASLRFPADYPRFSPTLVYRSRRGGGEDLVGTMIRNCRIKEGFTLSESESNPLYTDIDEEVDVDLILGTWNPRITCQEVLEQLREALHEGERFFDAVGDEPAREQVPAWGGSDDRDSWSGGSHRAKIRSELDSNVDEHSRFEATVEAASSDILQQSSQETDTAEAAQQELHGAVRELAPRKKQPRVLLCSVAGGARQTEGAWQLVSLCRAALADGFSTSVATITDPWYPRFALEDEMAAAWIVIPIFVQDVGGGSPMHFHPVVRSLAQQSQFILPIVVSDAAATAESTEPSDVGIGNAGPRSPGRTDSTELREDAQGGGARRRGGQGLVVCTEDEETLSEQHEVVEDVWWDEGAGLPLTVSSEHEGQALSAAAKVAALARAWSRQERHWGHRAETPTPPDRAADAPSVFVSYSWTNSREAEARGHIPRGILCGSPLSDPRRIKRCLESHRACMLGGGRPCWIDCENAGQIAEDGALPAARKALAASEVAVLFVSAEYAECKRCCRECELAIKRQVEGGLCVVLALVGSPGDGWHRSCLGAMTKGYPRVDFRGVADEEELVYAANELRRLIARGLGTMRRVTQSLLPLGRQGQREPTFEQLRFIDRARSRCMLPMVRIKNDVVDPRIREGWGGDGGTLDQTAPSPSAWLASQSPWFGRAVSSALSTPSAAARTPSGPGRTLSSPSTVSRSIPSTPHAPLQLGKRGAGVPSPGVGRTPSSASGPSARRASSVSRFFGPTSSLASSRSPFARTSSVPDVEIALRAGEVCPVVRYEVEAVVAKGYAPPMGRQGEMWVKEGQRVVLLRRFSSERNGRRWLPVCDARKRSSMGLVPEDHLQLLKAHTRLWVRNAAGVEVLCRCDNVVELSAEEASEAKTMASAPESDAWEGDMKREQEQTQALAHKYLAALEQLVRQGQEQGWLSDDERMLALNVGRCKVQDLEELLSSLPRMASFGVQDTRAAVVEEGHAVSSWFEREFLRLKGKIPATFRAEDAVRMRPLPAIVFELQLAQESAGGVKTWQEGVVSVELETLGDAETTEELCYHRIPWSEILVEVREACCTDNIAVEWAREKTVVASEDTWQACFDALLEDWHSDDGTLRGRIKFNVYDLEQSTPLPPHVAAGLPPPEASSVDTLTLECYTFTLEPDDDGARARKKAGEQEGIKQRGGMKRRVNPPLSSEQAHRLLALQEKLSATHVEVNLDWKWPQVRERLCKEFGFCVVPQYTPCDVLGHTLKKERRSSADPLLAKHLARDRTSEMIDNEKKWGRAVEEVVDDWHLFQDLNGTLTVHLHLDINQDIPPPSWLKRGGVQSKTPRSSSRSPSRPLSATSSRSAQSTGKTQHGEQAWRPRFLGDTAPSRPTSASARLGLRPRSTPPMSQAELDIKRAVEAFDTPPDSAAPAALSTPAARDAEDGLGMHVAARTATASQLLGVFEVVEESVASVRERKRKLVARNVKRAEHDFQLTLQDMRADQAEKHRAMKHVLKEKEQARVQLRKKREERSKVVGQNAIVAQQEHEREIERYMLELERKRDRTARPAPRADDWGEKQRVAHERRQAFLEQEEEAREARRHTIYLTRADPKPRALRLLRRSSSAPKLARTPSDTPLNRLVHGGRSGRQRAGTDASEGKASAPEDGATSAGRALSAWADGRGLLESVSALVEGRLHLASSHGGALHTLLAANAPLRSLELPLALAVRHGCLALLLQHTAADAFALRRCLLLPASRPTSRPGSRAGARSPVAALLALGKSARILKKPRSKSPPPVARTPVPSVREMKRALDRLQARFKVLSAEQVAAVRALVPFRGGEDFHPEHQDGPKTDSVRVQAVATTQKVENTTEHGRHRDDADEGREPTTGAVALQGGEAVQSGDAGSADSLQDATDSVDVAPEGADEARDTTVPTPGPIAVFQPRMAVPKHEPQAVSEGETRLQLGGQPAVEHGAGGEEGGGGGRGGRGGVAPPAARAPRASRTEQIAQRVAEIARLPEPTVRLWSDHGERAAFVSIHRMLLDTDFPEEGAKQEGAAPDQPVHYCQGCGFVLRGVNAATSHYAQCRPYRLLLRSRTTIRQARRLIRFSLPELGYTAEEAASVLSGIDDITELIIGSQDTPHRPPS